MVQIGAPSAVRRRQEILKAASAVFRRKGFHGAGMREIAASLGIAVGKLYYYFESKQDLLAFCQRDTLRRLLDLAGKVRGHGLPADQALYLLVRGHVRCLNSGVGGSLAHLEVESLDDARRRDVVRLRQKYEKAVRDLIAEGVRNRCFHPVDPRLASLALLGALNWTVKWYRPEGRLSLAGIERTFAALQVRALLAEGRSFEEPDEALVPDVEAMEES